MGFFKSFRKDIVFLVELKTKGRLSIIGHKLIFKDNKDSYNMEIELGEKYFLERIPIPKAEFDFKVAINFRKNNTAEIKNVATFLMNAEKYNEIISLLENIKRESSKREVALVEFDQKNNINNYTYGKIKVDGEKLYFHSNDGNDITLDLSDFYDIHVKNSEDEKFGYQYWVALFKKDEKNEFKNITFLTKEDKMIELKNAFQEIKNKRIEEYINTLSEFKKTAVNTAKKILDAELFNLVYKFLYQTNKTIFLDFKYFMVCERFIHEVDDRGQFTLTTYDFNKDILSLPMEEIMKLFSDVNLEEIKKFLNEDLSMFHKILIKKTGLDNTIFVTWLVLRMVAQNYFYEFFNNRYGIYFNDLTDDSSIHEYAKVYVDLDIINTNSAQNLAIFTYFLMNKNKFEDSSNFLTCNNVLVKKIDELLENKKLDRFERNLLTFDTEGSKVITIEEIDLMSGLEFEQFIGNLFSHMGFSVVVTKSSGDQGIDIIIEKNGLKFGVQTKCYSKPVTNKAIQEVVAGLKYYNLMEGIVVTNNYFTDSAIELAKSNGIILWDRNMLKEKLNEIFV